MLRALMIMLIMVFALFSSTAFAEEVASAFRYPVTTNGLGDYDDYVVSQGYRNSAGHDGIDFAYSCDEPIYAVANGTVVASAEYGVDDDGDGASDTSWGNLVRIRHLMPDGSYRYSQYAHLTDRWVSSGDTVSYGEQIGTIGTTGHSTGCHLHFQIITTNMSGCGYYPSDSCGINWSTDQYWATFIDPLVFLEENLGEAETCTNSTAVYGTVMLKADTTTVKAYTHTEVSHVPSYEDRGVVLTTDDTVQKWFVSDLDQDGYDDLIAAVNSSNNATRSYVVYLSNQAGGFDDYGTWLAMTRSDADATFFGSFSSTDDYPDLISGKEKSDGNWQWTVYLNTTGTGLNSTGTLWTDSFGQYNDLFFVGDMTGNGQIELYRGQENDGSTQGGDGNCTSQLNWRQLKPNGDNTSVASEWGYSASQYLMVDVEDDDKDELVQVRTCDNTVPVYVVNFKDGEFKNGGDNRWAQDVGNSTGAFYLGTAYWDVYPDLIRWGTNSLVGMENYDPDPESTEGHRKFRGANNSVSLLSSFPFDAESQLLFGNFGGYEVETETCERHLGAITTDPISDYDAFMDVTGLGHVDGEHFVGAHEQLIPSGWDFGHFILSLEAGSWMQYSWSNYACVVANGINNTEVIFTFDHTFTNLGIETYSLEQSAVACGYSGAYGTGDLVDCYDLATDNATDTYQGLIFSSAVESVVFTSSAADDNFCFQAINSEPDDDNDGVGVTLDNNEWVIDSWTGPEDQYLFIDTDQDGVQDPCIRRLDMILCDEDLDGTSDYAFSYGDGVSATYFSTGDGVAVVFNYGTFYLDTDADGLTNSTMSFGVSGDQGHYFGNHGAFAIQRSTRYFLIDNNSDGLEEWYYPFGWGLSNQHYYLADMNGDGETDLTFREGNLFTVDQTHEGGDDFYFTYGWGDADDYYFADLTGDGKDEVMVRRGSTFYVLNNTSIPRTCSTCSNSHNWSFSYGNGL